MKDHFPPEGFVLDQTAVPGITVYRPKPPEELDAVVDFHCPNCTATTAYSTDDGGLTCANCGYHDVPNAEQVGRRAEEFEFTVDALRQSVHGWGEERKELVCGNCAAHTTLAVADLTHACPFCGSNKVVQSRAAQDILRPRAILPFAVTTEQCREIKTAWLQNSWMLPDGLQKLGRSTNYVPVYIPFWTFDARAVANWQAEVAETRRGSKGSTYTTWKKVNGTARLSFDDLLVFGSNKIHRDLLKFVQQYDLDGLVTYSPQYLAGIQAQAYDIPLDAAWQEARQRMRQRIKQACKNQIGARRHRNFKMNLDFSDESWRYMLLPLYIAAYQYGDETFQVLINGQSGKIAGQRPVDWRKSGRWLATLALPALAVGLLTFLILFFANLAPDWEEALQLVQLVALLYLLGVGGYAIWLFARGSQLKKGMS